MFVPCIQVARGNNLKANMTIQDFEAELKTINKDLSIRPNNVQGRALEHYPDVNKLASIVYCGAEICTIPNYNIYDEKTGSYGIDIRGDGTFKAHRTRPEALQMVKEKLKSLENKDEADAFFGRGEYSDAELRKSEPSTQIMDEVSAEIKPIEGGMIEGAK